jgi:glutaredoxin 3
MGLAFLLQTAYLLPLTVVTLMLAVFALGFRAERRRGYGPLAAGIVAAVLVIVGKFAWESDGMTYGGIVLLVGSSVWNSWPKNPSHQLIGLGLRSEFSERVGGLNMATKRKVEIFSAGCPACNDAITLVQQIACHSCEVSVLDMNDANVASRAKSLGVRSVPAVVIDGKLADCCSGRGPDESTLRAAGLGQVIA